MCDLVEQADPPAWQREAVQSLVIDPICLHDDGSGYINGQHRSQAILDQGARHVIVIEYVDPPGRAAAQAALDAWADTYRPT